MAAGFAAAGDRWSRLTFLVYLNDDFEGGATTYYTANEQQVCRNRQHLACEASNQRTATCTCKAGHARKAVSTRCMVRDSRHGLITVVLIIIMLPIKP
jgi:hypothetical protein